MFTAGGSQRDGVNIEFADPNTYSLQESRHDFFATAWAPLSFGVATDPISGVRGGILTRPATDPLVFCRSQSTAGVALLTRRFGIQGYATSVHTACASGGQAIGTALKLIRRGGADYALAGGFDSMISPVGIGGFCLLSAVSADNDTPERASRPFDATRNGFVLGEGAGFLVLEGSDVGGFCEGFLRVGDNLVQIH